jgi:hypothetical protein
VDVAAWIAASFPRYRRFPQMQSGKPCGCRLPEQVC